MASVAGWTHLDRIRELDLASTELEPYELAEILERKPPDLRVLRLSGNPHVDDAPVEIVIDEYVD